MEEEEDKQSTALFAGDPLGPPLAPAEESVAPEPVVKKNKKKAGSKAAADRSPAPAPGLDEDEEERILENLSFGAPAAPPERRRASSGKPKPSASRPASALLKDPKTVAVDASSTSPSSAASSYASASSTSAAAAAAGEFFVLAAERIEETMSRLVADVQNSAAAASGAQSVADGPGANGEPTPILTNIARILQRTAGSAPVAASAVAGGSGSISSSSSSTVPNSSTSTSHAPAASSSAYGRMERPAKYVRREYLAAKHWAAFQHRLERPDAARLRKEFRLFEDDFAALRSQEAQSEALVEFIASQVPTVLSLMPRSAGFNEETAINCIEKSAMEALYSRAFGSCLQDDLALSNHIAALEFVTHTHLGVDDRFADMSLYSIAVEELYMISSKHVPFEKLECIVACARVVLSVMEGLQRARGDVVGADALLPVVIWVILRANPPCLLSNIDFVRSFRFPSLLREEASYYFVNFTSAVHFLRNLSASDLGLTSADYELGLRDAAAFRRMETERNQTHAAEAEARRLQLAKTNRDRFLVCEPGELDADDVAFLLADYRRLQRQLDEQQMLTDSLREQLSQLLS